MPRQRISYIRRTYVFPNDFPKGSKRFQHASGLPWAKIACSVGISPITIRPRMDKGVRPNYQHLKALHDLAHDLGLGYLFTD